MLQLSATNGVWKYCTVGWNIGVARSQKFNHGFSRSADPYRCPVGGLRSWPYRLRQWPQAYAFWLQALTPQISAPLIAIGSILGHLLMFRGFHRAMSRDRILPIVIGGLAGVPVGVWLLTFIPANAFRIFGGLLLAAYSLVSLAGGLRFRVGNRTPLRDGIIGLFGGICGGLASLSGPIMTIWCGLKGWTPDEQRAAYQPYNFAMRSAGLVGFGVAGFLTRELAYIVALSLLRRCSGYGSAGLAMAAWMPHCSAGSC
jgi:uncharacterized protein